METTKYALVLTGTALPGFSTDAVWPALAAYFRMEPDKLTDQVLVRAPLTIKESEDLGKLQTLQAGAASVGAEAEICAPDGRPGLFVCSMERRAGRCRACSSRSASGMGCGPIA